MRVSKRLRKNEKKILKIKHNVTEIKNSFDKLIDRLKMAKESASKLEETSKSKMQREKKKEKIKQNN